MRYEEKQVRTLYDRLSTYQRLFVGEVNGVRFMRFGGDEAGWQGAMLLRQPELLFFPYHQAFSLYTAWQPKVRRFLALGVGTGTAISHVYRRHPQAEILGVEWDPQVLELAVEYFRLPIENRVRLVEADVRTYGPRIEGSFDLIYLDVYFHEETPKVLYSSLYLNELSKRLEPGGILAINAIVATKGPHSDQFAQLRANLEALIGPTYYLTLGMFPHFTHNVMVFAQRTPDKERTLTQIRQRCWQEIELHAHHYPWQARLLPLQIRKAGKKV